MKQKKYNNLTKLVYSFQFKDHRKKTFFEIPAGQYNYHKKNFKNLLDLNYKEAPLLKILETGCGPGTHAIVLALMGFKEVLAVDKLTSNIKAANLKKKYYKLKNLSFKTHDFSKIKKISNKKFDLISCHNWLQHTPDPKKIFIRLLKYLKIGGKIYISTYTSHTFRHYISSACRKILKDVSFLVFIKNIRKNLSKELEKYESHHIRLNNITDDFYAPYIFTTTYNDMVKLGKTLGLKVISSIPKKINYYNNDAHQLKVSFIKTKNLSIKDKKNTSFFHKPETEFNITKIKNRNECNHLLSKIIKIIHKKNNKNLSIDFALKLYKLRAELHMKNIKFNRYSVLRKKLTQIHNSFN